MFLAKVMSQAKNETFSNNFFLWELDKEVDNCRHCYTHFGMTIRKHHCRNCGGIFCSECIVQNIELNGIKIDRCCTGCRYGETPGDNIRMGIEKSLATVGDIRGSRKVLCVNIPLIYGSPFSIISNNSIKSTTDTSSSRSNSNISLNMKKASPLKGYFEFVNKFNLFCCIKVISGNDGTDLATNWEIPRPSYIAIPPNGIVNGEFDPQVPIIEIIILTNNPYNNPDDPTEYIYDTKKMVKIAPCAMVSNFKSYFVYRINSSDRNVLLKYKGEGILEPRIGNSIARVGIFGKIKDITGLKAVLDDDNNESSLNFATNITANKIQFLTASNF